MKNFMTFLIIAFIIIMLALAYKKYCSTLPGGCKDTPYEDKYLGDDHMDA